MTYLLFAIIALLGFAVIGRIATADEPIPAEEGMTTPLPAAAARLYQGAAAGLASGYAQMLVAGNRFVGHVFVGCDNSTGSAGDKMVQLRKGPYRLEVTITSVAITDVGRKVYMSDSNTYTLTATGNSLVGKVWRYVTTNTAVVEFTPFMPEQPDSGIDFSKLTPGSETSGSIITTGSTWVAFTTPGACGGKLLLENQSDTGEFATWRMRARANNTTVSGDGGNSVGTTTCADFSASAQDHEFGNLTAVNACAQPNAKNQTVDATNIVTALYGRIDATGTSVGRRWVGWLDTHATTKADAGDYMLRISHNGTVANDGAISIYGGGRLPLLLNIEDATPGFVVAGAGTYSTADGYLACKINGTAVRIPYFTAVD